MNTAGRSIGAFVVGISEQIVNFNPRKQHVQTHIPIFVLVLALAASLSADDPPNAPAKNRNTIADLIQAELSREVNGKQFKSEQVTAKIKIGIIEINATAHAEAGFIDPLKELQVEVPSLQNRGAEGMRLTAKVRAPAKVHAEGAAEKLEAEIDVKGVVELEIEADIQLIPDKDGKINAKITIRRWDGGISDIDVGNGEANKVLRPILQKAAKKAIEDNRQKLQDDANRALKKASEDGRLQFEF